MTIANPDGSVTNARYFQVVNPVPVLNTISPTTIYGGSSDVTLSISGSRFTPTSIVTFTDGLNTVSLSTTTVSSTSLTAVIPAFWLTRDKTTTINVINPVPGGGQSASVPFTVLNPVPVMTSISPSNALAGSASFTLTVNGSNFDAVSVVNWNGSPVQTNFISTTQLTAIIPASLIATVGSDAVTVVTPAAGGGTSSPQTFTVYQTQIPVLTSISPTSVTQGSSATTITATGSNFLPTSVVNIQVSGGNQPLTTTFVSATQLTAVIPASYLTVPGYVYLTVTNPGLGGGTSYIRSLVVVNPVPTITTLAPTFAFAGGASFTLTVNGTGFVSSSQAQTYPPLSSAVLWNGQRLTTTFVSPTQLTATVPASSIASAGTASITVLTTGPGGGTSNAVAFPIVASNLTVSAGTVYNTNSVTGTLTLAAPASASAAPFSGGATGVYAPITSSNAAATFTLGANLVAGPDGTKYVYLAPGQTSGTFTIATSVVTSVTTATITATYAGAANTANLTITPTQVSTLAITPTNLNPGAVATGTLTLNGPAVAGAILSGQTRAGTYVPLITSSPYLFISGQPIVRSASGQQYAYFAVGQTSVTFSCVSASPPSTLTVSVTATLNGSTATANVIVVAGDHTPPVTTASLSGTQGSNGWYLGPVQVTLTATDDSSGVSATYYVLDGSTTATIYSSPFTISSDGVHTIKYWSLDKAGNTETTKTQTIKIDSISPTIAFGTPTPAANTAGWNNTAVDVPYTTSDATSGVASTTPGSPVHFASEGLHQVQTVTATDNAGNGVSSVTPQVNIDLTAPVSTGTLNGTLVTLSATDVLSGVKSTNYTVDGGTVQPYSAPFHVAGEGTHTVLYWSTDNADNVEAAKNLTLTTDTTAPTTTASLSGTQGNSGWYTSSVQVTLTATDTLSGVAATYYTIDGGTQQTYSAPFTVSGDAIHAITFYSVDNAGNTESTQSQTVKIDGTAPVTTGSSDSGQVTLTASDNLSGIASTYDTIDGGAQQTYSGPFTVGVGTHTVQYWSVDVAGNTETAKSLTVTLNAAPTLTSLNPSSANAGNPAFTLAVTGTGFVNGSVVNWNGQALATTYVSATSLTASVAASLVAAPGTASVTVTTPAPGGGTSNALSFTIVDVTPPTTTITLSGTQGSNAWTGSTAFNGWYRSAVQVTLTVTSTNANATTITTYYTVDGDAQHTYTGSFTVSSDGIHSVTYWSADQTGDTEASKAQTIKIDATKPVVTFGTPSPAPNAYGWNNTPVTIPYTSSDATSGIGFDPGPHPLPFTYGYQAWDLDIFDVAGNELQIESPTVNSDYTAPVTTASVSGATVTLSASDSLSGIAHTYYTIDSGSQQAYSSAITVGQGTHVVHYWSVDKADNSETAKSVSVSVDTTPPTTTATPSGTLGSNGWYTSSVQVTMAATDTGSGVAATYYKLDGGVQQTYSSAVTISAAGSHTIQYWSVDNAGNTESVKSLAIKIDSTAPVTTGSVSGAQVTLSASDSTSGVAATYYTIDSGSQQTYSAPFTVTGSGSHTVTYRSVDNAGNSETAKTLSVTVNAVPTITTLSPSSVNAGSAAFTLTITGTGYVNGSVIKWNGTALTTTYVSATSLTASIAATLVATAGTASVTVTTPGGTSNAATFTINAVSSPVTVTPSVASNSNYFGQENVTIANTQTITALTVTITVQRTTGVAYSGEYTNYAGGSITMANSSTASQVTYTYTLGAGKTVGVGSGWLTAAQFSGTGSVHPTTGDTYSVTCTAGGVVRTFSGHF